MNANRMGLKLAPAALVAVGVVLIAGCGDNAAKPDATGKDGSSTDASVSLREAIESGRMDEVRQALGVDANNNLTGSAAPLHLAIEAKRADVIELLLENKADIADKDDNGQTPLLHAASVGFTQGVEMLLAHSADPSARDPRGNTALHLAVRGKHIDAARLLLKKGLDPNAVNRDGITALHLAVDNDTALLDLLSQFNADINAGDARGSTALHKAAARGKTKAVEWLIQHNAKINTRNLDGYTPLALARPEVVDLLKKHGAVQ